METLIKRTKNYGIEYQSSQKSSTQYDKYKNKKKKRTEIRLDEKNKYLFMCPWP